MCPPQLLCVWGRFPSRVSVILIDVSIINPLSREVSAKIVFYGPGLSGKTTTLKYIYTAIRSDRRGEFVSLATETDRTIFFDFLPLHVEQVRGMGVRLQLYTVPGQVFYAATRKLVLNGADGVVFVADSQTRCRDPNLESFEGLRENLADLGIDIASFPLVFQYNKRDLDDIMTVEQLSELLNDLRAPEFCSSATRGVGVLPTLKEITRMVIRSLWRQRPTGKQEAAARGRVEEDQSIVARLASVAGAQQANEPASQAAPADKGHESAARRVEAAAQAASKRAQADEGPVEAPDETGPAPEPVIVERPAARTAGKRREMRPLSFAALWPERSEGQGIMAIEADIRKGAYSQAVRGCTGLLVELLESLPGPNSGEGTIAKATTLGLDGREYFRLCRLANCPEGAVGEEDALFALYVLVAAQIKSKHV